MVPPHFLHLTILSSKRKGRSGFISICLRLSVSVCGYVCVHLFACFFVCLYVFPSLRVCVSMSVCVSVRLSVCVSVSVCLSVSLSPSLPVCLSVLLRTGTAKWAVSPQYSVPRINVTKGLNVSSIKLIKYRCMHIHNCV